MCRRSACRCWWEWPLASCRRQGRGRSSWHDIRDCRRSSPDTKQALRQMFLALLLGFYLPVDRAEPARFAAQPVLALIFVTPSSKRFMPTRILLAESDDVLRASLAEQL